jgi:predicted CXXCH cytochrome family protein
LALLFAGGAVWLFLFALPVFADNGPHQAGASLTTDSCSSCHRTHTAQAPILLKTTQQNLCYTCHGTGGTGATTDVQNGMQYQASDGTTPGTVDTVTRGSIVAGALRGGGFDYALIDTDLSARTGTTDIPALTAGVQTTSSHSVNGTSQMAWGFGDISTTSNPGTNVSLECGSCHDPHGNSQYRILKATPTGSYQGTYKGYDINNTPGAPITIGGVVIADATVKAYTTTDYWTAVDANAPAFKTAITSWCATCHTRYWAKSGSWLATSNSTDPIFTYRHSTPGSTGSRACIQCHVAHGSNAAVGTNSQAEPLPGDTAPRGNDSSLLRIDNRGICLQCHDK